MWNHLHIPLFPQQPYRLSSPATRGSDQKSGRWSRPHWRLSPRILPRTRHVVL
jgi:hypothetical protein